MFRKISPLLALAFIAVSSFAQKNVKGIPVKDTSQIIQLFQLNPLTKNPDPVVFDTTMQEFHIYNPVFKKSFSNGFLGNSGQAAQSNNLNIRNEYSPFVFVKPFDAYFHNPYNISHYNTRKPFTQIEYVTFGGRDNSEQIIQAIHTQNVNQYTNFGIMYDLIASKGVYIDQGTKANRITLFGSHKKNIYSVFGNISLNTLIQAENGGLVDIAQFEQHTESDLIAYRMYLSDAESKIKKNTIFFSQNIDIPEKSSDTLKKSTSFFHLNHTFTYTKYYKTYYDFIESNDTLNFYTDNYYIINSAFDSAANKILENSFQISGDAYKFLPGFIAGIKHQYSKFGTLSPFQTQVIADSILQDTIIGRKKTSAYNNISVFFSLLDTKTKLIHYNASAEYFLSGYRRNDLNLDLILSYLTKNKKTNITASANFYLTEPDYFLKNYSSSHFQWNNNFPKMTNTGTKLVVDHNNGMTYASAGINLLGNYIYMDSTALPEKADKSIFLASLTLEKRFKWKGFNQINRILIQKSNLERVIQLPLVAYQNTSYYENAFFKKELKFQIGFDLYYFTSYYADAFMPATGMFYRQDRREIGNYPFLDAFINWKIKRTRFFLKYTNSLTGIAGYNYFTTYGYPMNERGLKFGLSWTFYN